MIKAVIFDFGQTLVDAADGFREAEQEAQRKIFRDLGLAAWDEFLAIYRSRRKAFHERSNFSRPALWRAVYEDHGRHSDSHTLGNWEKDYWERVQTKTTVFPEAERVLESLAANTKLAMITNTRGQKTGEEHRLSQFPNLKRHFEVIIVAGEGGVPPKPDPAPFRKCLQELAVSPGEAVYVGDDWRIDIRGAHDAGLRPIWLQHRSVRRKWPKVKAIAPVITSLEPLLDPKILQGDG